MKEIATLERVRKAQEELQLANVENPSADAIRGRIGGGSKSTILGHMRTLAEEATRAVPRDDVPLELLRSSMDRIIQQLWDSACAMAQKAYRTKLDVMLSSQGARFEELQAAALVEEDLHDQLVAAQDRIAELEGQLERLTTAEQQVGSILEAIRTERGPIHRPMVQLLRLLDAKKPRTRDDLFKVMMEARHTRKQADTALHEASNREYVKLEEDTIVITDKGIERLRRGVRRS